MTYRSASLALLALCTSSFFICTYTPWWTGDSNTYTNLAMHLTARNFSAIDGSRTPLYPLFLTLAQFLSGHGPAWVLNDAACTIVVLLQAALGVATALLLLKTSDALGIDRRVGFIASCIYASLTQIGLSEVQVLSEILASFFTMLFVYGLVRTVADTGSSKLVAITAIAGTAAILTRPQCIIFIGLTLACLTAFACGGYALLPKRRLSSLILFTALPLVAWAAFNAACSGYFTLSTYGDANRAIAVYDMFSEVSPQDRVLGEIMQRYYVRTKSDAVVSRDYLFTASAGDEIYKRRFEMPIRDLSSKNQQAAVWVYIGSVSSRLMLQNPRHWVANAVDNMRETFDFLTPYVDAHTPIGDPRSPDGASVIRWPSGAVIFVPWHQFDARLMLCVFIFALAALPLTIWKLSRSAVTFERLRDRLLICIGVATCAAMYLPCFLAWYTNRFGIPLYSTMFLLAGISIQTTIEIVRTRMQLAHRKDRPLFD